MVMLKFSRNIELLRGAWLLKSFQQREGQRICDVTSEMGLYYKHKY